MKDHFTKFVSTKVGLFFTGALFSALISCMCLAAITGLWQSLPVLIHTAPDGRVMNLAIEANRDVFDWLRSSAFWVLCLGPPFTGFCLASHKKLSSVALLVSSLTTLLMTSATLLVSVAMWALTHLRGASWHLSGHSPNESYGKYPQAVQNFLFFFSVACVGLHMAAFFVGLIWTDQHLRRVRKADSSKGISPH